MYWMFTFLAPSKHCFSMIMGSSEDEDDLVDLTAQDASKKHVEYDKKHKQVVRDMRIREDVAYYLRDLTNENFGRICVLL